MSIRRGPLPERDFLILRNEVLRDTRLTFRALGLLAEMLSYPPNWRFTREWLASRGEREGVSAVRTAMKELETAGYLVRTRYKDDAGRWQWDHVVHDTPRPVTAASRHHGDVTPDNLETQQVVDIAAGHTTGQESADGNPTDGNPPSIEDGDIDVHEDGLEWPAADASGAQSGFTDWRSQDRARFVELVGSDWITSEPESATARIHFTEGRWDAALVYDALVKAQIKSKGEPIKWPGRYLARMDEHAHLTGDSAGAWLARYGLFAS